MKAAERYRQMTLHAEKIITGRIRQNCYVVSGSTRHALVIDPGAEYEAIAAVIAERDLRVAAVVNTHGHYDHIGAVGAVMRDHDAPFYLSGADERILRSANILAHLFEGATPVDIPTITHDLRDAASPLRIAEFEIRCIPTPGHTPGGTCFEIRGHLFTGDTLFRGNVGRTDLPGGDRDALAASLRRLSELPPDLIIHPGHGQDSLLGAECTDNAGLVELLA